MYNIYYNMNSKDLKNLIREELKQALTEKYQDQYKLKGRLITNIKTRHKKETGEDLPNWQEKFCLILELLQE